MSQNQILQDLLACEMNYGIRQKAFSPLYSYYNLVLDRDVPGIKALYLDYNRKSAHLWEPFMKLPGNVTAYTPRADHVAMTTDLGAGIDMAYYAQNAFVLNVKNNKDKLSCFAVPGRELAECWVLEKGQNWVVLEGYSLNRDERDPDQQVGIMAGLRVIRGALRVRQGKVSVLPDANGEIYLAATFSVMNINAADIKRVLNKAANSVGAASWITRDWMSECIGNLSVADATPEERRMVLLAVNALIFNLAKAPGNLEGYVSSFPSRGSYTTHFTWDSCFQNLAYEQMNPKIAEDSILQLLQNMRQDGKIPQFLCSTWNRPHEVQPALIGWAALRLADQTGDKAFMKKVLAALEINNNWWLTQRMTRFGVIYCPHGLETGQDDSPRFDDGAVLALDMNSYLLSQLRVCAELARRLGMNAKAVKWEKEAEKLGQKMIDLLYDPEKNFFFDALAGNAEKRPLLSSSGFIPLWAGVPLPEDKIRAMIRDLLLDPTNFYGNVPFPSVAYTEEVYQPGKWWRGPTWMPEAWLMLEVLKKYGFEAEYKEAMTRLYKMILKNGQHSELFNSATGEGLGNPEQGWTAAIFIRMFTELHPQ